MKQNKNVDIDYLRKIVEELLHQKVTTMGIIDIQSKSISNILCKHVKVYSKEFERVFENILPLQHSVADEVCNFKDITDAERDTLINIANMLHIEVLTLTKAELEFINDKIKADKILVSDRLNELACFYGDLNKHRRYKALKKVADELEYCEEVNL